MSDLFIVREATPNVKSASAPIGPELICFGSPRLDPSRRTKNSNPCADLDGLQCCADRAISNLRDYRDFRIFRNKGECAMTSTVTAAEVSKNFGAYQDAAVREPVIITKNGRPRTVLMAYEDFVRLSKRDRRVQRTSELSDDEIAAVERSEMTADPLGAGSGPHVAD